MKPIQLKVIIFRIKKRKMAMILKYKIKENQERIRAMFSTISDKNVNTEKNRV